MMNNKETAEAWGRLTAEGDMEASLQYLHPDFTARYPQSREVIRGKENFRAMVENYPAGTPEFLDVEVHDSGEESVYVPSPFPFGKGTVTVTATGTTAIVQAVVRYPDGQIYNTVSIVKFKEGLIAEETAYFGTPFEAPEWRSEWAEVE